MAKILITGGAGFIGSQLGYKLHLDGHQVILLDDMSFGHQDNLSINGKTFGKFVLADIRDKKIFKLFKQVDYVFHFAGISALPVCQENPYYAISVNTAGTANVLEAARLSGVKRVIFASTAAIYENNKHFPSKESDQVSPDLIYATSKLQAELICRSFINSYGLNVVIIRYNNVYGPHQDFQRKTPPLTGYIIRELLHHRRPILHSSGQQRRDYVYVDDVNNLNILCMTHPQAVGEIFNAASGKAVSVQEIFDAIASAFNSDIKPIYQKAEHYWDAYPQLFAGPYPLSKKRLIEEVNKYSLGSYAKAKRKLGWQAHVSLSDGMKRIVEFATNNKLS